MTTMRVGISGIIETIIITKYNAAVHHANIETASFKHIDSLF